MNVLRLLQSHKDYTTIVINHIPTVFTRTAVEHLRGHFHLSGARIAPLGQVCVGNEAPLPTPVQLAALDKHA